MPSQECAGCASGSKQTFCIAAGEGRCSSIGTRLISRLRPGILGQNGDGAMSLSRRKVLQASAGALAAPYVIPALAADTLVVNGYGAEFQEIITRTTIEPFEQ